MYKKVAAFKTFLVILILFPAVCASASDILGYRNWQNFLAGSVISPLTPSSFGFTAMTDGGLLTAFSENGTILWQKPMGTKEKGFASCFTGDFIYSANGKKISLFNPSGNRLWSVSVETQIIEKPCIGFDGRVYVKEKSYLSCYTLTGMRRFRIKIPEGTMNLAVMNDGSILHIQKKEIDGKSTALRISPFGEIIEEIIFTGKISCIAQSNDGILLGFTSGIIALCTVIQNTAQTKWTSTVENSEVVYLYDWDGTVAAFFKNGLAVRLLYGEERALWNGAISAESTITECVCSKEYLIIKTEDRIISFTKTGEIEKNIDISGVNALYSAITSGGYFIVCDSDWSITAYRITVLESLPVKKKTYPIENLTESGIELYAKAQSILNTTDAGLLEKSLMARTSYNLESLRSYYMLNDAERKKQAEIFNPVIMDLYIQNAASFRTALFTSYWPFILDNEKDESIIRAVLKGINQCAYDEEGLILSSIENKLIQSTSANENMNISYCDTVVEICRFMGRPSLMRRGKDILVMLLGSRYSSQTREYARKSLEKIIELEI